MFAQIQYQYMKQWYHISERSHTCLSNQVLGNKHKFVKLLHFASLWLGRKINNAFVRVAFTERKQRKSAFEAALEANSKWKIMRKLNANLQLYRLRS